MPLPPSPEQVLLSRSSYRAQPLTAPPNAVDVRSYLLAYREAMKQFDSGNWVLAQSSLQKAISFWPSPDLYVLLGYTFYFRYDFTGATKYFEKAAKQAPTNLAAHFSIALAQQLNRLVRYLNHIQKTQTLTSY
jgi:tetratricopeptide (TPR) repeat protein